MEYEQMSNNNSTAWSNEEILSCYKSISLNALVQATMVDEEMKCQVLALAYINRGIGNKKVYFEELDKVYVQDLIKELYIGFLEEFEQGVKNDSGELFKKEFIFKDSPLYHKGGIFDMEEAVYALRDQVLGNTFIKVLNNIGGGLYLDNDKMKGLKRLMRYDSNIHKGVKYNCYKNHLVTEYLGLVIFGGSMLFQSKIELDDIKTFDSFFDKFDSYFMDIMNKCGIEGNCMVNSEDFSTDIKTILDMIIKDNHKFIVANYYIGFGYEVEN